MTIVDYFFYKSGWVGGLSILIFMKTRTFLNYFQTPSLKSANEIFLSFDSCFNLFMNYSRKCCLHSNDTLNIPYTIYA